MNYKELKDYLSDYTLFANVAPKDTPKPYVTYFLVSPNRYYSHDGYDSFGQPVISFRVYADRFQQAKDLTKEIIIKLENWKYPSFLTDESDFEEEGKYVSSFNMMVNYKED